MMNNPSASNALQSGNWTLNPTDTSIGFASPMFLGLKAKGHFDRFQAMIIVGESAADSSVTVTIRTDSVNTGIKMRDTHLRAEDVFDAERFQTIEFRSTSVAETPTGIDVTGDLLVRDVTRPVSFHVVRVKGSAEPRFTAEIPLSPKDFGITRPGTTKRLDVLIDATLQRG